MALIVTHGRRELRFETAHDVWDAVRRGELSIEDTVVDLSSPDAVPRPVAELQVPRVSRLPKVNGWYVLGSIIALRFVSEMFELPLILEVPVQVALVGLAVLRFFDPRRPELPKPYEDVFRRRR